MHRSFLIALLLLLGVADLLVSWHLLDLPCPCSCAANLHLRHEWTENRLYAAELDRLADDLAARQTTLPDAAAELEEYLQVRDYDPLTVLSSRFDGLSDQACLALVLLRRAASNRGERPTADAETLATLERQFEQHYGVTLPENARGEDSGRLR